MLDNETRRQNQNYNRRDKIHETNSEMHRADHKRHEDILTELKQNLYWPNIFKYKANWIQDVDRIQHI